MAKTFQRPIDVVGRQDTFTSTEVGVTHPNRASHIRLTDNGDIEITSGEGCAIVLSASSRTIQLVADNVKLMTKDDGLRWNSLEFNHLATSYNQPTFLQAVQDGTAGLYRGVDQFLPSSSSGT